MPSPCSPTGPICSPASLEEKATLVSADRVAGASLTVAVAVVVEVPLATMRSGESDTVTLAAGPAICVSVAWPVMRRQLSVAVIVGEPTVVELVIVAV